MSKTHAGIVVASAAAIAAAWTLYSEPAALRSDVPASDKAASVQGLITQNQSRLLDAMPMAFSDRFPRAAELQIQTPAVDRQIQDAKDRLAEAMRAQAPQVLATNDTGNSPATGPKVPLPKSRPLVSKLMADLGAVSAEIRPQPSDPLKDVSGALRKVFAMLQPSGTTLASASPDGGISNDGHDGVPSLAEKQAALYDITARTVYMPDGTRLEAHSGLGDLLDDPNHVDVHDRGATPPQVYELTLREKPFHGVEALRMKPVGQGDLFGRTGLLTHSYMMGPNGDSNGCVSFKDYEAFLKAYKSGNVKRLIVVPSLSTPTMTADAQKA